MTDLDWLNPENTRYIRDIATYESTVYLRRNVRRCGAECEARGFVTRDTRALWRHLIVELLPQREAKAARCRRFHWPPDSVRLRLQVSSTLFHPHPLAPCPIRSIAECNSRGSLIFCIALDYFTRSPFLSFGFLLFSIHVWICVSNYPLYERSREVWRCTRTVQYLSSWPTSIKYTEFIVSFDTWMEFSYGLFLWAHERWDYLQHFSSYKVCYKDG